MIDIALVKKIRQICPDVVIDFYTIQAFVFHEYTVTLFLL